MAYKTPNTTKYWQDAKKNFWSSFEYLMPWEEKKEDFFERIIGFFREMVSSVMDLGFAAAWGVAENLGNALHYAIDTPRRLEEESKAKREKKEKKEIEETNRKYTEEFEAKNKAESQVASSVNSNSPAPANTISVPQAGNGPSVNQQVEADLNEKGTVANKKAEFDAKANTSIDPGTSPKITEATPVIVQQQVVQTAGG